MQSLFKTTEKPYPHKNQHAGKFLAALEPPAEPSRTWPAGQIRRQRRIHPQRIAPAIALPIGGANQVIQMYQLESFGWQPRQPAWNRDGSLRFKFARRGLFCAHSACDICET